MRKTLSQLKPGVLISALLVGAGVQAQGLTPSPDALGGPFWQARFERDAFTLLPQRGLATTLLTDGRVQTLRLLGDYQFSALRLGETGGLRLTGGLLINLRVNAQGMLLGETSSALPYAGIGYASSGFNGALGFSADLGLTAPALGGLRLDRAAHGAAVDGSLRVQPMLRLGMNLVF